MAKQKQGKSGAGFFFGLMLGLAVGATLGILFAPQAGEDTRTQLNESTVDLRRFGRSGYQGVADKLRKRYGDAFAQGREAYERAKDEVLERYNTRSGA
jgi:gas vesicle protein